MNIVYNSQHYHVVEYPGLNAYELIDKTLGRRWLLRGRSRGFLPGVAAAPDREDPTIDSVDEFLGGFESLLTQPVRFH